MLMTSSLTMILYVILVKKYHTWYSHPLGTTADSNMTPTQTKVTTSLPSMENETSIPSKLAHALSNHHDNKPAPSGLFCILRHNYLIYILAVSCLYKISLTCLDYEMYLVSLSRFEISETNFNFSSPCSLSPLQSSHPLYFHQTMYGSCL